MNTQKTKAKDNGFKIESGIPMPPRWGDVNGLTHTLKQMEVGESFEVPDGDRSRISAAMTYAQTKHPGRKYSQRTVEGGKRVWRTA
jgi:hypothetical protein